MYVIKYYSRTHGTDKYYQYEKNDGLYGSNIIDDATTIPSHEEAEKLRSHLAGKYYISDTKVVRLVEAKGSYDNWDRAMQGM